MPVLFLIIAFFGTLLYAQGADDPYFRFKIEKEIYDAQWKELREEYQRDQKRRSALRKLHPMQQVTESKKKDPLKEKSIDPSFREILQNHDFHIKQGVRFDGMHKDWAFVLPEIRTAFGKIKPMVTSGTDGQNHRQGKRSHYNGYKLDLRVRNIPGVSIKNWRITQGRAAVDTIVSNLNKIPNLKATYEQGVNYPHIDILLLAPHKDPVKGDSLLKSNPQGKDSLP